MKAILDIGANDGSDTVAYLKQGYYVYSVEANPHLCDSIRKDIPNKFSGMFEVINAGVYDTSKEMDFYISNKHEFSSFKEDAASKGGNGIKETVKIQTITLTNLINDYVDKDIEYIKIDVDGANYAALTSMKDLSPMPKYLSVELGDKSFLDFARQYGYSEFFVAQQNLVKGKEMITHLNGSKFPHTFSNGDSGKWGRDIPNWHDPLKTENFLENITGWNDMHCR